MAGARAWSAWSKWVAAMCGLAVVAWAVYRGLTWDLRPASADAAGDLRPVAVVRGTLEETVTATGRLEPRARVVVQSEIPGIVSLVHVDDGDRVERGQALVELDRERLVDRVAERSAALERRRALARLDRVGEARAELEKLRRDRSRARALFQRGILSRERIDAAEHAARMAEIRLANARHEHRARLAAVREAENSYRRAGRDLEKSVIRSPIDGVVVRRAVEVGSAVADLQNGGTVTLELADDSRIHLLAEVDENDVAGVHIGQRAEVRIDAFPGESFPGFVRKVSFSGSQQRGVSLFDVEVELEPDARVRVGMSADARIRVAEHPEALLIPNVAILRGDQGPRVRVRRGESGFELVPIREGSSDGFQTLVSGGLREGEIVLVRQAGAG